MPHWLPKALRRGSDGRPLAPTDVRVTVGEGLGHPNLQELAAQERQEGDRWDRRRLARQSGELDRAVLVKVQGPACGIQSRGIVLNLVLHLVLNLVINQSARPPG